MNSITKLHVLFFFVFIFYAVSCTAKLEKQTYTNVYDLHFEFKPVYAGTVIGIASIIGYLPDSFYYIIFGKWMDKFGNNAYPMIFGFLMGTAALGMVITILMRKLIKKNNKKEGI